MIFPNPSEQNLPEFDTVSSHKSHEFPPEQASAWCIGAPSTLCQGSARQSGVHLDVSLFKQSLAETKKRHVYRHKEVTD